MPRDAAHSHRLPRRASGLGGGGSSDRRAGARAVARLRRTTRLGAGARLVPRNRTVRSITAACEGNPRNTHRRVTTPLL
jgi:hypothetical protein